MKTREQLLEVLAGLKNGKEYALTLEVIESNFKEELRKKNNEAKNLRTRLLDVEKVNRMVIERYTELVDRLRLDTNIEHVNKNLEDSGITQNVNLTLQKKLERMEAKCKQQEIEFTTESSKERRKMRDELNRMGLISTLHEAKAAYVTALLNVVVSTM